MKLVTDVAANVMTVVALVVGAGWALWVVSRERVGKPKADVALELAHRALNNDEQLLHVKLNFRNAGRRRITLTHVRVEVCCVLPLSKKTLGEIHKRGLVREGETEAEWPEVTSRIKDWPEGERPEIEPGERDGYGFDFIIPADLKAVSVYTYVDNAKSNGQMGWSVTELYELSEPSGAQRPEPSFGASRPQGPLRSRLSDPGSGAVEQQPPRRPRPRDER